MTTREALQKMQEMAEIDGYKNAQGIVWGLYSSRTENGLKVQSISQTYKNEEGEKLTLCFDASTDEIY